MAAPALPLFTEIYRGDTIRRKFEFKKNGVAINITGWKLGLTLKEVEAAGDVAAAVQVFTTAGDDPLDDAVNGIMYIQVESDAMAAVVGAKTYAYDVQRSIPQTSPKPPLVATLFAGRVKVLEDITDTV